MHFAKCSLTWREKFIVMNSTIGLVPERAAPTPRPAKPASVIGVSITRFSPCFSKSPLVTCIGYHELDKMKREQMHLISALVLANFFTKKDNIAIPFHFFINSHIESFPHCDLLLYINLNTTSMLNVYRLRRLAICIKTSSYC